METYNIEITDTFGGEANYSWVRRYTIEAKTRHGAILKLAKLYGNGWRQEWFDGETTRYNLTGACVCCFVNVQY